MTHPKPHDCFRTGAPQGGRPGLEASRRYGGPPSWNSLPGGQPCCAPRT